MQEHVLNQSLFTNPIVAIEISDVEGRITQTNTAYRSLLGYDESELLELSLDDLCHGDDIEHEGHERRRLLANDCDHLTFRKRYLTKSGNFIWGDTTTTVVRDTNGEESFFSLIIDKTVQQRQELLQHGRTSVLELLYRNRSMQEVCTAIVKSIEAVEEGLLCSILQLNHVTGRLHKIAAPSLPDFYNEAIEGMKIGEGVGSCGAAAFHGQRVIVADILNHPNWQQAHKLIEKTDLRSCWSQPIFDSDGKVLGTFAIYYTEPREPGPFELELINSAAELTALTINHKLTQAALQKSDQLKSEFISIAAHELNTPLATILGYVELMRHTKESGPIPVEKSEEYLEMIDDKAEAMSRIINDLLDISQIEGGHNLSLDKQPKPICKLLTNVLENFKQNSPNHQFSLQFDDGIPEILTIDAGRIVQILENLLSNAVKYSPAGGTVELLATAKGEQLKLVVIDHGIGMSSEQLNRIFEKFYRADNSNTSIQGLGLGMSIVREIVEAHGGQIRVDSAPTSGTKVTLLIPFC